MRALRNQLFWAISVISWVLAYSQKCDIALYSAPCGARFVDTLMHISVSLDRLETDTITVYIKMASPVPSNVY